MAIESPHCGGTLRRRRLFSAALVAAGFAAGITATPAAAAPPVNTLSGGLLGGRGDTAILGYDTVAYFTDGRAIKGLDAFTAEYRGAKWKFASQAHLDLFKADPAKYTPQYGGYCAYGVSQGALVKIDPEQFKVIGGKLYLNYDADVQKTWLEDPQRYIREADGRFQSLLKP